MGITYICGRVRARTGTHIRDIRGCVCNAYPRTFLRFVGARCVGRCEHGCGGGALVQRQVCKAVRRGVRTLPVPDTYRISAVTQEPQRGNSLNVNLVLSLGSLRVCASIAVACVSRSCVCSRLTRGSMFEHVYFWDFQCYLSVKFLLSFWFSFAYVIFF